MPAGSSQQVESLIIPKQQRQKQRKQQRKQRQQNIPKGASVPPKTSQRVLLPPCFPQGVSKFQQEALMAASAPQAAPVPVNLPLFQQGTPQGAAVPDTQHLRQQKPSPLVQSIPGPPMPSQSKRLCPWSTEASVSPFHLSFKIIIIIFDFKFATMFSRYSIKNLLYFISK